MAAPRPESSASKSYQPKFPLTGLATLALTLLSTCSSLTVADPSSSFTSTFPSTLTTSNELGFTSVSISISTLGLGSFLSFSFRGATFLADGQSDGEAEASEHRSQRGPTGRQTFCPKPTSILRDIEPVSAQRENKRRWRQAHRLILGCRSFGSQLSRFNRVCSGVLVAGLCHPSRLEMR